MTAVFTAVLAVDAAVAPDGLSLEIIQPNLTVTFAPLFFTLCILYPFIVADILSAFAKVPSKPSFMPTSIVTVYVLPSIKTSSDGDHLTLITSNPEPSGNAALNDGASPAFGFASVRSMAVTSLDAKTESGIRLASIQTVKIPHNNFFNFASTCTSPCFVMNSRIYYIPYINVRCKCFFAVFCENSYKKYCPYKRAVFF